ncbi:MAG: hypothetical protein EZS28_011358 [Streblomastix strix]|uniref:Uncharacterized protein n=1 Tax=Streblomastix strix TaxID=222440 RepID=A0A5J4WFI8_9EUKA|nr:MAG: hypothetical protein EZS28_011358 [Streblomastix strix]
MMLKNFLKFIENHLWDNKFRKLIFNPKIIHSLSVLSLYKLGTHLKEEEDGQRKDVRHWSRYCLWIIQFYGNEQDQTELFKIGYGRVISIAFCTAGGVGEEEDAEIFNGLFYFSRFLRQLHEGRARQPSLQQLPLLVRRTEEQMEEEGSNEELQAQIKINRYYGYIKKEANLAKAVILNHFIHKD